MQVNRFPSMTDAVNAEELVLLTNTLATAELQRYRIDQVSEDIMQNGKANITEYIYLKKEGAIRTLKLVEHFYLDSYITSTESDVSICLVTAWNAFDWLLIIRKSDQSDKIKRDFFWAVADQ